jgi:hypothetical protein
MVDAGLASIETENLLNTMYPDYIKIKRAMTKSAGAFYSDKTSVKVNNPFKKAKGGSISAALMNDVREDLPLRFFAAPIDPLHKLFKCFFR